MKVMHVITGLGTGGAETMLTKLVRSMATTGVQSVVVSLTDMGHYGSKLSALGIPVHALGMKRGLPSPRALARLIGLVRSERPALVQTWLYHADLAGGLAAWFNRTEHFPVVWNIRQSDLSREGTKRGTLAVAHLNAKLSSCIPVQIVCCSEAARLSHEAIGYAPEKIRVIPNGFDLDEFEPNPGARISFRRELGVDEGAILIGLVGRFDPQKDHANFLAAAGHLRKQGIFAEFVLVGDGILHSNQTLMGYIRAAGVEDSCHLLGRRSDMPRIMAALDISTSSSFGEGFPNVIGEAMACAVPCVVTAVGDSPFLVGDTGLVVPPKDPEALSHAWLSLVQAGNARRSELGSQARQRITEKFSMAEIANRYEMLYREVTASVRN